MNRLCKWAGMLTITAALLAPGTASANPLVPAQVPRCADWKGAWASAGGWVVDTGQPECPVKGEKQPGSFIVITWELQANTRICVQGRGFNAQNKPTWYSLGCGVYGYASVPWGTKDALPKVRAKAQAGYPGGAYRWTD